MNTDSDHSYLNQTFYVTVTEYVRDAELQIASYADSRGRTSTENTSSPSSGVIIAGNVEATVTRPQSTLAIPSIIVSPPFEDDVEMVDASSLGQPAQADPVDLYLCTQSCPIFSDNTSDYTLISSSEHPEQPSGSSGHPNVLNGHAANQDPANNSYSFSWRPTEAFIERRIKNRYPMGSKGLKVFRCELPYISREARMDAFLDGYVVDNANRFYLEELNTNRHILSQDISMQPYLPRGQVVSKGSTNWLDRMETFGELAKHSRYFFPAPSKLSQEITIAQDGELQVAESREYLAAIREPTMFPKGSRCIGPADDCYMYTSGPFYGEVTSMTTASPSNSAPSQYTSQIEGEDDVAEHNMTLEIAHEHDSIAEGANIEGLTDRQGLADLNNYQNTLTSADSDHDKISDDEVHADQAVDIHVTTFAEHNSDPNNEQDYLSLASTMHRPVAPSPNKARHYHEQFESAIYTDSEDSESEYDSEYVPENNVSVAVSKSSATGSIVRRRPHFVIGHTQSMPDLRHNYLKDLFTTSNYRAVSYEGVGALPHSMRHQSTKNGIFNDAAKLRRASSPFMEVADDEFDHNPDSVGDAHIDSEIDDDDDELAFDSSSDSGPLKYVPTMDLADAMMRAALVQATREVDASDSSYSIDNEQHQSLRPGSMTANFDDTISLEANAEFAALDYISSCCDSPFKSESQESLNEAVPAYQQQRSRSSTLQSSGTEPSGDVAQLYSLKNDWPFESYDDDLETVVDLESPSKLVALAGPARSLHYGPMYPVLAFRRQLSLCATWRSDADLLMETARLSAERQAQAMVDKAFEQPPTYEIRLTADRVVDFAYQTTSLQGRMAADLDKPLPPLPSAKHSQAQLGIKFANVKTGCKKVVRHLAHTVADVTLKQLNRVVGVGKKKAYFIPH